MTWRADHVSATRGTGGNFMGEGEAIRVSDGQPSGSSDRRFGAGAAPSGQPYTPTKFPHSAIARSAPGRCRPAEQGSRTRPGRRDGGRGSCVRSRRGRGLRRDVGPSAAPAASRASAARGLPPRIWRSRCRRCVPCTTRSRRGVGRPRTGWSATPRAWPSETSPPSCSPRSPPSPSSARRATLSRRRWRSC